MAKKWCLWTLIPALCCVFAALAIDYTLVDTLAEPPEAISVSGFIEDCIESPEGIIVTLSGNEDVWLFLEGVPDDAKTGYRLFDAQGNVLCEGEGRLLPVESHPGAVSAYMQENAPYFQNVFLRDISSGSGVFVSNTASCSISLSCDDYAMVNVGPVSASSSLNNPSQASGVLRGGHYYGIGGMWKNIGGPAFVDCQVTVNRVFDENEPDPPNLIIEPDCVYVVAKTGGDTVSADTVSVSMSTPQDGKYYEIHCTSIGEIVEYKNGIPAGMSKGMDLGIARDGSGKIIEKIQDGTLLRYIPRRHRG